MKNKVKTTERGWASHFIGASRCRFHRNTLIEYNGIVIVVSTVGAMVVDREPKPIPIGYNRYYETMVWYANNTEFQDAEVSREQLDFDCPQKPIPWDEINANNIHDSMVEKWKKQIKTLEK